MSESVTQGSKFKYFGYFFYCLHKHKLRGSLSITCAVLQSGPYRDVCIVVLPSTASPAGMGSKVSGQAGPPPEGAILDIMRRKYGDKALKYLNVWTAEFGFPVGGSLGLKNILLLEERLKKKELEMRKKKKISVKKLEIMEGQKECLQIWKEEADARNREIMQKQLPFTHERTETNEKQDLNTARTSDLQISSSLFPQLA